MKCRLFYLVAIFFIAFTNANAQDQEIVFNLNRANGLNDTIDLQDIAKMTVSASDNGGQTAVLTVSVVNMTLKHPLLIFKKSYYTSKNKINDDELKKELGLSKIECKNGSLASSDLGTQSCNRLAENVLIPAGKTVTIIPGGILSVNNGDSEKFTVPIHTCDILNYNKDGSIKDVALLGRQSFSVIVHVNLGPDTVYQELKEKCDDFINKITSNTFCKGKKHQYSIEQQQKPYKDEAEALKDDINRRYYKPAGQMENDNPEYFALKKRIDEAIGWVNDTTSQIWIVCEKCKPVPKKCIKGKKPCKKGCKCKNTGRCTCDQPQCGQCRKINCPVPNRHPEAKKVLCDLNKLGQDVLDKKMCKKQAQKRLNKIKDDAQNVLENKSAIDRNIEIVQGAINKMKC